MDQILGNNKKHWHYIKENPNDIPTHTGWYVCKIKSSDDLTIVYGYETVTAKAFDAWMEVKCPY